jgi:peroxiredoxin
VQAMKFSMIFCGGVLLFAVALTGQSSVDTPRPMPKFELRTVDGKFVKSKSFAQTAVLFAFIATWDKNSQRQLGPLKALHRQFATNGFSVVAIALDTQNPDDIRDFVARNSLQFSLLLADYDVIRDFGGLEAIPTLFLANPNGVIVHKYVGVTDEKTLEPDIKAALLKVSAP